MSNKATEYAEAEVEHLRQAIPTLNFDDQALLHFSLREAFMAGYGAAIDEIKGTGK